MNAAHYRLLIETTHDGNQSLWSANGLGCLTPNPGFDGHFVRDTEQSALDSVPGSVKQSRAGWPEGAAMEPWCSYKLAHPAPLPC